MDREQPGHLRPSRSFDFRAARQICLTESRSNTPARTDRVTARPEHFAHDQIVPRRLLELLSRSLHRVQANMVEAGGSTGYPSSRIWTGPLRIMGPYEHPLRAGRRSTPDTSAPRSQARTIVRPPGLILSVHGRGLSRRFRGVRSCPRARHVVMSSSRTYQCGQRVRASIASPARTEGLEVFGCGLVSVHCQTA